MAENFSIEHSRTKITEVKKTIEDKKQKLDELKQQKKSLMDAGLALDSSNLDSDGTTDESELSSVIGVGASSVENDITSYSNYGSQIDLIAPAGGNTTDGLIGILSLDLTGTNGINTPEIIELLNPCLSIEL